MRKNGVIRTFEPLGECFGEGSRLANGFTFEKPPFSRLSPSGTIYCSPPAESAYVTSGNVFKPYYHELSEIAAKKDKAKAVMFLEGEEKPFSTKEKEVCEKRLKELFFDLKIGKNELAIFTNDASPSRIVTRRYKFSIGGYACEIDFFLRTPCHDRTFDWYAGVPTMNRDCYEQSGFIGSVQSDSYSEKLCKAAYRQIAILTDARISSDMLCKMLESLSGDPLGFRHSSFGSGVFDSVAFLSSCCADNYMIDQIDSEYVKAFKVIRSMLTDFLEYAAEAAGKKLIKIVVSGARSAREASEVAASFAQRFSVIGDLYAKRLSSFSAIEAIGAAKIQKIGATNVYVASSMGRICVLYEGKPLFPNEEAQNRVLLQRNAQILVQLGLGNYSYSACIYLKDERNEIFTDNKQEKTIGE